jgi:hypothetical protein
MRPILVNPTEHSCNFLAKAHLEQFQRTSRRQRFKLAKFRRPQAILHARNLWKHGDLCAYLCDPCQICACTRLCAMLTNWCHAMPCHATRLAAQLQLVCTPSALSNFKSTNNSCACQSRNRCACQCLHIQIPQTNIGDVKLVVAREYQHLGGVITENSAMGQEVSSSSMMQTFRPLERRIFGAQSIEQDSRMALVGSLLHTKTFYNAGTWTWMHERVKDTLRTAITKVVKVVARMQSHKEVQWRDDQVYDELSAPTVKDMLSAARVRCLNRFLRVGAPTLWALAQCTSKEDRSWSTMVLEDLHWMFTKVGSNMTLPDARVDMAPWLKHIE